MNSEGISQASPLLPNAASIILGQDKKSTAPEADILERIVQRDEKKLRELEAQERQMESLSQKIQVERAKEAAKKRNILIGAGLIALGGIAAIAGAAHLSAGFLIRPVMVAALGGEGVMLYLFQKSSTLEGALASEKVSLDIRLENHAFQKSFRQKLIGDWKQALEKVREEDQKKLLEELKNMPAQSVEQLEIQDTEDFILIGNIKLRKKSSP
jgi:hypothetical protein